jgi:protein gp37
VSQTAIEWTDTVWNPVTGCSKVSEGCRNCYAFALHDMRHKAFTEGKKLPRQYAKPFSEIQLFPGRLLEPLRWKKPRRVFVNSMSDLFHEDVPEKFLDLVFASMGLCYEVSMLGSPEEVKRPRHIFQILTKRPERMLKYMKRLAEMVNLDSPLSSAARKVSRAAGHIFWMNAPFITTQWVIDGFPGLWLGVSVENQKAADERIPLLLQTPAAVRFLSCEPLLGPVDLSRWLFDWLFVDEPGESVEPPIHWVIAGGESGSNARPMHPDWARDLRDQCQAAGVAYFHKQNGEWTEDFTDDQPGPVTIIDHNGKSWKRMEALAPEGSVRMKRVGKKKAGRLLDGREWNEIPPTPPINAI